ncbi:CoA pyrophosphatase [Phenylobacterium sp.]|uniref:CoA pyrophosphatase n=1 Tax=Phenylobacterium sp. TaxID=1871053 RepID=UPI0027352EF4|nr:CoA pyrophosphatase [Phenylobacterium sp.]MDP3660384.1 CoA pyrophosphatase [Phenylobacterium sp.]
MRFVESLGDLRAWVARHLDPIGDDSPISGADSDFDLNPTMRPAQRELRAASVLVPLVERADGYTVILTRRSDALRSHTGQVALPGGRRDPGESAWQTALREAHEEIGLEPDYVELAGLSTPYETGSGYLITPVVGFVREGFTLTPNPDEVADIFETPFGFLMDPANYEQEVREAPDGQKRSFYAARHEDRYIWGATAGMLRALYSRLYGAALA